MSRWLSSFALYALLLAVHVHGLPSPVTFARRDQRLSDALYAFNDDDGHANKTYAPLAGCESACQSMVANLQTCDDDSCICTQDGVNSFSECASCDTRISTWRGEVNMTHTMNALFALCEHQKHPMADVTTPWPVNTTAPSTSSADSTSAAGSGETQQPTTVHLTSAAYASLSIAAPDGQQAAVTVAASQPSATSAPTPVQQFTGAAFRCDGADWVPAFATLAAVLAMACY